MLVAALLNPPQPFNWITDPTILAWIAVASLIIGVVSIAVAYIFYRRSKNLHRVIYEVISDTPIVSVKEKTGRGKIEVTYESGQSHIEKINDASLLTLRLWNEGNGDVIIWKAGDKDVTNLEEPIQFEFEGRTVVDLTAVKTEPSGKVIRQEDFYSYLNSPSPSPTSLCLPRCILKQGQFIQLSILLNGPRGNIKLKAGKLFNGDIKSINELERRTKVRNWILTSISGLMGIIFVALVLISSSPSTREIQLFTMIVIIVVAWWILSVFAPFRCTHRYCGYKTWNFRNMHKHVEGKHSPSSRK
jgi:hypothetical protein